jgi:hypothetical protein
VVCGADFLARALVLVTKRRGTSKKGVLFLRQCRNDGSIATSLRALFGSKGPYIELEVSWR